MRAYASVAGPSIMLAADGRDPGASAASTDRSCMAYESLEKKATGNRPEKERSAALQTHRKLDAKCMARQTETITACLGFQLPCNLERR
ncbi:hypothetical protein CEP51_010367 [Fusarium floridanum]|uniref:Uncharacterized protein n=1 Tax=Fusarium floridanum TaxID=1325733 RepID=A0A428RER5_9HYPO|nr:hypothetical protein CEP51_010367 [Fusarium floridanum]